MGDYREGSVYGKPPDVRVYRLLLQRCSYFTLIYGWLPWRFCLRKATWCKSVSSLVAEMLVFYRYWTVGRRYLLGSWSSVWSGSWQTRRVLPLKRRSNKVSKNHQTHAIYCTYTVESQLKSVRYCLQLNVCGNKRDDSPEREIQVPWWPFIYIFVGPQKGRDLTVKEKFDHRNAPIDVVKLI